MLHILGVCDRACIYTQMLERLFSKMSASQLIRHHFELKTETDTC